ncbi:Uncharacterised protein [Vibrio cholerae]|nr:Uncharacterised protein [Vibrio cholerae]
MQQKNQSELATNHSPTALNHFFLQKRFLQKYEKAKTKIMQPPLVADIYL